MFSKRTVAIIKRELKSKLLSKTFIIMTILVPVLMFALIGVQLVIHAASEEENPRLLMVSETKTISERLETEFNQYAEVRIGNYKINYDVLESADFSKRLTELKDDLLNEKLTGIIYVPEKALINKSVRYYSQNPSNRPLFDKIRPGINKALINIYFEDKQLSQDDVDFARDNVEINGFRITKSENIEEEGYGNLVILILFTFLLYMALIFSGQATMLSVVEEKSNRIVEVLLSSASSTELMIGKIIGTVITEVIQMTIWLLPLILLISTSWFMLPAELMLQLDLSYIVYYLLNFTVALFTYIGLFAMVGAIFDNPQDAQSGIWPLLILVMIPFLIAISLQSNPQSGVAKITSLLPFTSLMVMPARMALVEVPFWELILSFAINLVVLAGVFPMAGKIYKVGILITGKKPKWSEVRKWLMAKG